jgi:hypothetical protein
MKEVKFISTEPYLSVRYGSTTPKKKVSFSHGCLITKNPEEIAAVRELIARNIIFGIKEITFEEKPEAKKPEAKKEEAKKEEAKKPEAKKEEEISEKGIKLKLK